MSKAYNDYIEEWISKYNLNKESLNSLIILKSIQNYIDFQQDLFSNYEYIYIFIGLFACTKLYNWIAIELKSKQNECNYNVYVPWIDRHMNDTSLKHMEEFLNEYPIEKINLNLAVDVFRRCMNLENGVFNLDN